MKNIIKLISLLVLAITTINPAATDKTQPVKKTLITIYYIELDGSGDLVWRNEEGEIDPTPQTPPKRIIGENICFPQMQSATLFFTSKKEFKAYLFTLEAFQKSIAGISRTQVMPPDDFIIEHIEFNDLNKLEEIPDGLSFVMTELNPTFIRIALKE